MTKKNRTVIITGGAGFIGSHLCEKLLSLNNRVILVDVFNLSKNEKQKKANIASISSHPNLTLVDTDIRNKTVINNVLNKHQVNILLHLAAKADVTHSITDPIDTIKTNLLGTTVVFETAARHRIKHIIYASSSLIYGKEAKAPIKEDYPCSNPTNLYAASMRAVELEAHALFSHYGIPVTGLRFFPVYGPRMRNNLVIPVFVKKISQNKPVVIYGNGKTKRSYSYIDDIVDGIIVSLNKPNGYQIINLGNPTPISLLSLISTIEKVLGKKTRRIFKPQRKEEIPNLYPDITKAKKLLGFTQSVSLEEGIRRYVEKHDFKSPTFVKTSADNQSSNVFEKVHMTFRSPSDKTTS